MISVVIPTLNAQAELGPALAALVPAAIDGLVSEVVIADGGSRDETAIIAEAAGAVFTATGAGRGLQLMAGAEMARCRWLLFLHADTVLEAGWEREAQAHISAVERGVRPDAAAAFRHALDDLGMLPRSVEAGVALRCLLFRLPYGDQGLLISRRLYDRVGGFRPLPLMEDVDLVRRLGRRRLVFFHARAVTSARRYKQDGYLRRVARNLTCLMLYCFSVPSRYLVKIYG